MEKRPAEQATIPPIDAPPWVSIRVIGTAGFTVECSRCGAVMWLYQVTASSKPGALQAVVDEHALCVARAA